MQQTSPDLASLAPTIVEVCRRYAVTLVYVFGSCARGHIDAQSDLDLAVLAAGAPSLEDRRKLQGDLHWDLSCTFRSCGKIDLIVLQRAPVLLEYNIIRKGRLLFAADRGQRIAYELDVQERYDEEEPLLEMETNLTLHRLLTHRR